MKKFIIVLVLLLPLLLGMNVFAASDTYRLPDLELTVTIPSDYYVITRETLADDPVFKEMNVAGSSVLAQFESNGIYLNAISVVNNDEIVVTMTPIGMGDLSKLSDTALDSLASTLVKQYASYGVDVVDREIYQQAQSKFIKVHFYDSANNVHGMQYYTIYSGKAMNVTLRSYSGSLSSDQETFIKNVVDSIVFDNPPQTAAEGENTDSFDYTDENTGVTFTVPANWKQEEFSQPREFIDAKFVSTKEAGCTMIYGSIDLWEQMTSAEKKGLKREEVDNSYFSVEEIAKIYGTTSDDISKVTYNGVEYYQGLVSASSEIYGTNVSVTMTQLLYIENGWAYSFQFAGTPESKLFPQFTELVESVQYPSVEAEESNEEKSSTSSRNERKNSNGDSDTSEWLVPVLIVAGVVLIIAVVTVIVCVSIARKKRTKAHPQAVDFTPGNSTGQTVCPACGHQFPADGRFCPSCGSGVPGR